MIMGAFRVVRIHTPDGNPKIQNPDGFFWLHPCSRWCQDLASDGLDEGPISRDGGRFEPVLRGR